MAIEIDVLIEEELEDCLGVDWLRSVAEQVLSAENVSPRVEMGLVIASAERVQKLNRDYLGSDEPTDVIAFAMLPDEGESSPFVSPPDGMKHIGEVIISYPQALRQAEEQGHSVEKEITILVIHGVLHLLGYEDEEPELKHRMAAREAEILSHIDWQPG